MKLWYRQQAEGWTEALPLGNGYMGAMCYGGAQGRFDLSEATCWSGKAEPLPLRPGAGEAMTEARKALLAHDYKKGMELLESCTGIKENYGTKLPMGKLTASVDAVPLSVYRELELDTGIAADILKLNGAEVRRESFISSPDKVMAVSMTADKPSAFQLWLEGYSEPFCTRWNSKDCELHVKGRALDLLHSDGLTGVVYHMVLKCETDGTISRDCCGLLIENATRLTMFISADTDMFDKDPLGVCTSRLHAAWEKGWDAVRSAHIAEHSRAMKSCTFSMPDKNADLPTDERVRAFAENQDDLGLVTLFFQYGRYLIFNSSRPDTLIPASLQGIWSDNRACRMSWTDDIHLDINTQMNYYPTEATGLGDCALPLLRWIKEYLVPNGTEIAKTLYGARGWCAHTVSNAHGWAAPGWEAFWGMSLTCGGWVATHIWEHYQYTNDVNFLSEYYDVLYQSALFLKDMLVEAPDTGELIIVPAYSPENRFTWNGASYNICDGSTFDMTVARAIFQIVQESAEILDKKDEFTDSLTETLRKLAPYRVGKYGQLMEWYRDFEESIPDHRHTSHLLSMHPFNTIDPSESPELKAAIETTLKRRLGENAKDIVCTNWAGALLILYSARLLNREKAREFIKPMIASLSAKNLMITHQGALIKGIYELDGNTGFTAGVIEVLMQSYNGKVHILPAVPDQWENGEVTGLHTRGNHILSAKWDKTTVTGTITAGRDGEIHLLCYGQEKTLCAKQGETFTYSFKRITNL